VSTAPVSAVDSTAPLSRGAGDGPPRSAGDEDADDTLSPAAVYALAASRQLASADGSLRHRVPIRRNVGFHAPDPFHRVGSPQRHWALNIDTTGLDKTPVYKIGDHDRADPLDGLRAATGDSAATRSKASSSAASVDHRGVPAYNDQIQLESVAHHGYEDDTDDIMSPLPFDSKTAGWYDPAQFAGMDFAQLQQFLEDEDEDSPFPEVRASVSNIDDPDMPCLTFRAWFLGLGFCAILSLANLYFSLRYPAPLVTPLVAQIVSYPVGKLLAAVVSARTWRTPKWAQRLGMDDEFSFNPGPFNIKEHTIVILMTNTSGAAAYSFNYTLAAEKFYFQHVPYGLEILILLATQLIGFGMAGIARRFLVWPAAMIWPTNLVFCTVLNTLHAEEDDTSGSITRFRFFTWAFAGAFVWFFFPGFIFTALSAFSYVCWAAPNNAVVNQLFGVYSGLGMGIFTFDWSQIAYIGSPLVMPWWAEVNVFTGFFVLYWVVVPILYYTNTYYTVYLPLLTSYVYDRYGARYNTTAILTPDLTFNETAYEQYSPLFLPVTFAMSYVLYFALSMALLTHTGLYYWKDIVGSLRRAKLDKEDIHFKLMKRYKEVPDWWYWAVIVVCTVFGIVAVEVYDEQLPIWALFIAILLPLLYVIPGGLVYAISGQQIAINVLVELVGGYIMPGKPFANMLFKAISVNALAISMSFVQDLKLGHYMKIPPRVTFMVQLVAGCMAALLQSGFKAFMLHFVPDLCEYTQPANLMCPSARVYFSASITWGLIGPARMFGIGQMYNPLMWSLLAGAILPVPFWFLTRRWPDSWVRHINVPIMLAGLVWIPPATGINYSSWFLVGFIFQFWMRRYRFRWWSKFNFVLSAGLDVGTVISGIVIFLALQLPKGGALQLNWWGNTVYTETDDYYGVSYLEVPPEGFGPASW